MINERDQLIIDFIKKNAGSSSKDIFENVTLPVSYATLKRDLTKLISNNFIVSKGQGKGTKYFISPTFELLQPIDIEDYYKKEIDERKDEQKSILPHVIVVPNRVSPQQRNFAPLSEALAGVNAIMAPPISDLSAARSRDQGFDGMKGVEGTRFYSEIERLGQFIVDYVVSGELDRIYAE